MAAASISAPSALPAAQHPLRERNFRMWWAGWTISLFGDQLANVHIASWVQQRVDPTVRGRVLSVLMLSVLGLMPVSLAVAGLLIAWNMKWMFILAGTCMLLITALQKQVREIE